jgi:hypothetical protein
MKFACPCCGYLTLLDRPPGTFDICPVCGWEDDDAQFNDPELSGGANQVSLREARANFHLIGAESARSLPMVRRPAIDEISQN